MVINLIMTLSILLENMVLKIYTHLDFIHLKVQKKSGHIGPNTYIMPTMKIKIINYIKNYIN